jgi:hypothetical protein
MDFYLTRLPPLLGGLILRTSSSNGLGGLPVCRPEGFVGVKFSALVVLGVLLAAVGAFFSRLTRCLGWVDDGRCSSRCLCRGKEFFKHRHHCLHLLRLLCLEHVCHLSNHHGLSLGIREFFFRCLVRNAFTDGSGGGPVPFDHLGEFSLDVHAEVREGLVDQKFGVPFLHCCVELARGLVSQNGI